MQLKSHFSLTRARFDFEGHEFIALEWFRRTGNLFSAYASYIVITTECEKTGDSQLMKKIAFGKGGFEIAALSAGLTSAALASVLRGNLKNAYSLSRPPGHHCLPDWPNGFCLLANIGVAIEAAKAKGLGTRFAVIDWDGI